MQLHRQRALRGEFGDVHNVARPRGSELFINPLMTQYRVFDADQVIKHMEYAGALARTGRFREAEAVIEARREELDIRARNLLPL